MSELHAAVKRYGHRALILYPGSKRPISTGWPDGESKATRALNLAQHPDANVGMRCGDGLVVLDYDPRHADAAAESILRTLPDTFRVLTGGGGEHHYFRDRTRGLPSFQIVAGLELKAKGTQVVAPPSIHPDSGRQYVDDPGGPSWGTFAQLPASIAGPARALAASPATVSAVHRVERKPGDFFQSRTPQDYALVLAGVAPDRHGFIPCPSPLHPPERTPSLQLLPTADQGWRCFRSRCVEKLNEPNRKCVTGDIYGFAAHCLGVPTPMEPHVFLYVRERVEREFAAHRGVQI